MVRGIEKFKEYFQEYANQYVLIGGTACDISFSQHSGDFRATRDLDVVLIVEALTPAFGERFWQFIHDEEIIPYTYQLSPVFHTCNSIISPSIILIFNTMPDSFTISISPKYTVLTLLNIWIR